MANHIIECGKGISFGVDFSRFSPAVLEYLQVIGCKNVLRDCGAGKDSHEARQRAVAKLDAMYRGETRSSGEPRIAAAEKLGAEKMLAVAAVEQGLRFLCAERKLRRAS